MNLHRNLWYFLKTHTGIKFVPHVESCNATLAEPCLTGAATKAGNDHVKLLVRTATLIKTVKWKVICDPAVLQGATYTAEASYECVKWTGFRKSKNIWGRLIEKKKEGRKDTLTED